MSSMNNDIIADAFNFTKNIYDGHTLYKVLKQIGKLRGKKAGSWNLRPDTEVKAV